MKIAKHICFYYKEDRIKYLKLAIDSSKKYAYPTDIFIHTNIKQQDLEQKFNESNIKLNNTNVEIISHDLKNEHGFFLTWKPRILIKEQIQEDIYDAYIYTEDDIEISSETIQYWIDNYHNFISKKINLGFIRIDTNVSTGIEYWCDSTKNNSMFNRINNDLLETKIDYCAFWIYCKEYTKKLIENIKQPIQTDMLREKSAYGLNIHSIDKNQSKFFDKTAIPIVANEIDTRCKVKHLPSNYVKHKPFCYLPYKDILNSCHNK